MSIKNLRTRHAELTRDLILDAAIGLLTNSETEELSVRSVAQRAGMSERTVFRYFAARDELLDAVAAEMNRRLAPPLLPERLADLPGYPAAIFARFEALEALTRAALRSDVYERIRSGDLVQRGVHIAKLIDEAAPDVDAVFRRLIAANIHYHVIASSWAYYRFRFGFSAEDTVAAASLAIDHALAGLSRARGERE